MATSKHIQTNFAAGELSPQMRGRIDLAEKYAGACAYLDNYVPLPTGGLARRPGMRFVKSLGTAVVRLLSFTPDSNESFLLVLRDSAIDIYSGTSLEGNLDEYIWTDPEPVATVVSPYSDTALWGVRILPSSNKAILFHPSYPPMELLYSAGTFSLSQIEFTSPPFKKQDTSNTRLTVTNEQWIMKLVSDNEDEFDSLTAAYVEFRLENEWALGRVLTTSTTPAAPANPSGSACYIEPVTAIVRGVSKAAKMVVLDNTYDPTEIPSGKVHIRSDTLVFGYDLEDAYIRVESNYDKIRTTSATTSQYALGGTKHGDTMWLKIESFIGQKDYPTSFITNPARKDLKVGSVYRILARSTFDIEVSAPVKSSASGANGFDYLETTEVEWDASYRYRAVGENFSLQNHYRINANGGELADLNTSKVFDIVECSPELTVYSCTGNVRVDDDQEKLGHTATMTASKSLFLFEGSGSVEEGQYILAKHGDKFVLYQIDTIVSDKSASVLVIDGVLPRQKNSARIIDEGQTTEFRISEWSSNNYPTAAEYFDKRLVFAGTREAPETVWLSRVSDNYDFRTIDGDGKMSDDAGITYPLGGKQMNRITSLTSGPTLVVGTESARWQLRRGYDGEAITPINISITEESSDGVAYQAIRIGSSIIFVDRTRQFLSEFTYSYDVNGWQSSNMNIMSDHLFEGDSILDFCYQQKPHSILWVTTAAGRLFSLTYNRTQGLYAWARHTTKGLVKSVAILQGSASRHRVDRLLLHVSRNGQECLEMLDTFYSASDTARNRGFNFLDSYVPVTHAYTPVEITQGPVGGYFLTGAEVAMSVTATGTAPLTYQWYRNNTAIEGATDTTYTISSLSSESIGSYKVRVSNILGSKEASASVAIGVAPVITVHPVGDEVAYGAAYTLTVTATGTPAPTYQWKLEGVDIPGARSSSYHIPNFTEDYEGTYTVVATNQFGSATSNEAEMTAEPLPLEATVLSDDKIIGPILSNGTLLCRASTPGGGSHQLNLDTSTDGETFTSTALGTGLSTPVDVGVVGQKPLPQNGRYFLFHDTGGDSKVYDSADLVTWNTSTMPNMGSAYCCAYFSGYYYIIRRGSTPALFRSNTLTSWSQITCPVAYSSSTNRVVAIYTVGTSLALVYGETGASDTGLHFYRSADGTNFTKITVTATAHHLRKWPVMVSGSLWCFVEASDSPYTKSLVKIEADGSYTQTEITVDVCGATLSSDGYIYAMTVDSPYKIVKSNDGLTWLDVVTLPSTPASQGGYFTEFDGKMYFYYPRNGTSPTLYAFGYIPLEAAAPSGTAPAFTTQPTTQSIIVGATLTLTAVATGDPAPTHQWYKDTVAISGATSSTYTVPNAQTTHSGTYKCVATNSVASTDSTAVTVSVGGVYAHWRIFVLAASGGQTTYGVAGKQWSLSDFRLEDQAGNNLLPTMTLPSQNGNAVFAQYNAPEAYRAMDGNATTAYYSQPVDAPLPHWFRVSLASPIRPYRMKFTAGNNINQPELWQLEASTTGSFTGEQIVVASVQWPTISPWTTYTKVLTYNA